MTNDNVKGTEEKDVLDVEYEAFEEEEKETPYFSVKHVSDLLGVSDNTIRNWQKELEFFVGDERDQNDKRVFTKEQIRKLQIIAEWKNEGLTTQSIKKYLMRLKSAGMEFNIGGSNLPAQQANELAKTQENSVALQEVKHEITEFKTEVRELTKIMSMIVEQLNSNTEITSTLQEKVKSFEERIDQSEQKLSETFKEEFRAMQEVAVTKEEIVEGVMSQMNEKMTTDWALVPRSEKHQKKGLFDWLKKKE